MLYREVSAQGETLEHCVLLPLLGSRSRVFTFVLNFSVFGFPYRVHFNLSEIVTSAGITSSLRFNGDAERLYTSLTFGVRKPRRYKCENEQVDLEETEFLQLNITKLDVIRSRNATHTLDIYTAQSKTAWIERDYADSNENFTRDPDHDLQRDSSSTASHGMVQPSAAVPQTVLHRSYASATPAASTDAAGISMIGSPHLTAAATHSSCSSRERQGVPLQRRSGSLRQPGEPFADGDPPLQLWSRRCFGALRRTEAPSHFGNYCHSSLSPSMPLTPEACQCVDNCLLLTPEADPPVVTRSGKTQPVSALVTMAAQTRPPVSAPLTLAKIQLTTSQCHQPPTKNAPRDCTVGGRAKSCGPLRRQKKQHDSDGNNIEMTRSANTSWQTSSTLIVNPIRTSDVGPLNRGTKSREHNGSQGGVNVNGIHVTHDHLNRGFLFEALLPNHLHLLDLLRN